MPGRELPKTVTRDEAKALLARCNQAAPTGLRDLAMLTLMYRAGLRVSETCGLHVRDVDWRAGTVRLRPEVAKGGREAVQPLDDDTLALLERWKQTRRAYAAGKPWLFTTLKGGPVSRHCVWEMTARRARRAGIDHPVWPHALRHTYACELLADGFTIVEVQRLMRHADLRTTAIYLHVVDVDLAAKVRSRSGATV